MEPIWKEIKIPATEFPHNMTEEQWRHELAARAMTQRAGNPATQLDARECFEWAKYMIAEGKRKGE